MEFTKDLHTIQVVGREVRSEVAGDLTDRHTATTPIQIHHWQVTNGAQGFWFSRKFKTVSAALAFARNAAGLPETN